MVPTIRRFGGFFSEPPVQNFIETPEPSPNILPFSAETPPSPESKPPSELTVNMSLWVEQMQKLHEIISKWDEQWLNYRVFCEFWSKAINKGMNPAT